MNILYLGQRGSYSEILAKKAFPHGASFITVSSFEQIVEKVLETKDTIGVLGIENSSSSSVHTNVDLIFNKKLYIVGEATMNIRLDLIGRKGAAVSDITDIYSHPQALAQCSQFIQTHGFDAHAVASTTSAVEHIAKQNDPTQAAIGSAASLRDKQSIIHTNIANHKHNVTRWVFVSNIPFSVSNVINKMTVIFKVKHEIGSLVRLLQHIAHAEGNMTRIESRPVPGSNWEYQFWIDLEIPENSVQVFTDLFEKETQSFRLVGSYERGIFYNE